MNERRGTVAIERRTKWRYAPATKRFVFVLFVLSCLVMAAATWKNERDSCLRNAGVRHGFNETVTIQGSFLRTAQNRARTTRDLSPSGSKERLSAADAVKQYDKLISAQKPVKTLDCGGLFPDNQ